MSAVYDLENSLLADLAGPPGVMTRFTNGFIAHSVLPSR